MAYTTPETNILFLENVPLDNSYTNTLYFASRAAQTSYFQSMKKITLDGYSYQRATSNEIKVGIATARLYTCNYMMFQNTAYSDKWFYAFILNVEYVNDHTTLVTYEIDEIQTWLFDFTVSGWVAREHTATDEIGDNILPEPVETGEYVTTNYKGMLGYSITSDEQPLVCVAYVDADGGNAIQFSNTVTGCKMRMFTMDDKGLTALQALLNAYISSPDSIVSMYMLPYEARPIAFKAPDGYYDVPNGDLTSTDRQYQRNAINKNTKIDGYSPRNKKLLTYPYNYLHIDNASGGSLSLRYEFFKDLKPQFSVYGTFLQPVKLSLRPLYYKNVTPESVYYSETYNAEYLTLESYPICSWNSDIFKAWLAQSALPTAIKTIATTAMGNLAGGVAGLASLASGAYDASIAADQCRGSMDSGSLNFYSYKQDFYAGRMHITAGYAKMIDQFFDRYGYNVSRTGTPLTHSRPHWNYVQMTNCDLTGSVPANAASVIINAHNAGITYWRKGSEVGNYTLDNSI